MIMNNADRARFVFAGNATFTLVSKKTGARFTYKIRRGEPQGTRAPLTFASVLSGPDNQADYTYMGIVVAGRSLVMTRASRVTADAPSFRALRWFLENLDSAQVECHHEGRCGRCGRALTVPSSIESGLGPECASKI